MEELRRSTQLARREALRLSRDSSMGYDTALGQILARWMASTCAAQKVIGLAAAVELGLVPGRCDMARCQPAMRESSALRALYWAAIRRAQRRVAASAARRAAG